VAEESDLERTEEASPTRIEKAREEGDIPRSRELATCAMLFTAGLILWSLGSQFNQALKDMLIGGLSFNREMAFSNTLPLTRMTELIRDILIAFAPIGLILIIVAIGSPILVGGWNFSSKLLMPNFNRLNPLKGITNMVSKNSLVELVKAIAKATLVGIVSYMVIDHYLPSLLNLALIPLDAGINSTAKLMIQAFLFIVGSLVLVAALDVPYQLFHYASKMKMSKEELKQESKESNGNPEIKARVRQQQREMARRRMMSQIPKADVIITNPTHYAVAIQYNENSMRAPKLIAKGSDAVALRIREIGKENKVMLLESPKLARAIYAHTEIEQEIPEALYLAVAEILAFVFQVRNHSVRDGAYPVQPNNIEVPDSLDPHHPSNMLQLA
jgi:flagellar biosynthetic protein FlhB